MVSVGTFSPGSKGRLPDMATLTCPACAAVVGSSDLICFTCGANLPKGRIGRDAEDSIPVTVAQKTISPEARRSKMYFFALGASMGSAANSKRV